MRHSNQSYSQSPGKELPWIQKCTRPEAGYAFPRHSNLVNRSRHLPYSVQCPIGRIHWILYTDHVTREQITSKPYNSQHEIADKQSGAGERCRPRARQLQRAKVTVDRADRTHNEERHTQTEILGICRRGQYRNEAHYNSDQKREERRASVPSPKNEPSDADSG